jgi:hypothetical protein
MKKPIIIIIVAAFLPFITKAQGVGIGIKGGANFANQAVNNISTSSITDYHVGGYVNLNLSKKFGITPEVLYSVTGSEWNNAKVETDYIAVPVMIRYKPISLLSLEAGPQFSFLTKAEKEDEEDFQSQIKNNDFGLAFGAALHLPLGLQAGARYVLGFTNISEASGEEVKNRTFQLYVGWTIFGAK